METLLLLTSLLVLLAAYAGRVADGALSRLAGPATLPVAWVLTTAALATRWASAGWGHPPVADWRESLLCSAWVLLGLFLAVRRRLHAPSASTGVAILAAVAIVAALLAPPGIAPLAPALRSRWLAFHAVTLAAAYAAFSLAFVLAAVRAAGVASESRRRRMGAGATAALAALGCAGGGVGVAVALFGLAWSVLDRRGDEDGGTLLEGAFHLGSWWALLLGLALAEAGEGIGAAPLLVVGAVLCLLSLAASPLAACGAARRIGSLVAAVAVPAAAVAGIALSERLPWGAVPLAALPLAALLAGRRPAPRPLLPCVSALLLVSTATALPGGRGSVLLAAFLVSVLVAVPGREADPAPVRRGDDDAFGIVLFGFALLTAGIASGAAWAQQAWGTYWGWDPKETWSLIVWLVYAGYLHARLHRRWGGEKAGLFLAVGLVVVLFTYIGVSRLLPGLHSYL